ncbi:MAG: hypothetical protein Q9214_000944 [Letrouitia sp. 1 TL-2023]
MPSYKDDDTEDGIPHGGQLSRWEQDGGPEPSTSASSLRVQSGSASHNGENGHVVLPVWLRESSKSFHWRWVPLRIRKAARVVAAWTKGPDPPQMQKINPFFPSIQEAPVRMIDRYFPEKRHKAGLFAAFYLCWILTFLLVLHHSAYAGSIKGYGQPAGVWCGASFWSANNRCGLDGNGCRPFDNSTFAFRCPANCRAVQVLNPHAVGDQEINYQPFVIGGPKEDGSGQPSRPIYRADTFLCQAAIHAGVISNQNGGCGVAKFMGEQTDYQSSSHNGIESIGFDASFPKSFTFVPSISLDCVKDLRWPLLAVTVTFTTILSLCTSAPYVFFPAVFTMLFLHVGLVSDPPISGNYASLSSLIIGRFLPAAFCAVVFYQYSVKYQQTGLTAYVERTILWLGGAWIGSLNNYTFSFIPLQRLTPHDLKYQPGAHLALALVILLLVSIALGQIWYLRLEGRLPRYIALYALFGTVLIAFVILPSLNLRIHHYILALLLLPGTRLQTRPSLLYQGILVGLFINGTARWGFASILQTTAALREDGQKGTILPNITTPVVHATNITFSWALSAMQGGIDTVSVLVNDVERYRWYHGEGEPEKTFYRQHGLEKEYFRFGYMKGSTTGDYTKAGIWESNGTWTKMAPGPS